MSTDMIELHALGYLIAHAINSALTTVWDDGEQVRCCTQCCGPCASLVWYRDNNRGRADAAVSIIMQGPSDGYSWQNPYDGSINWDALAAVWSQTCPNHDEPDAA